MFELTPEKVAALAGSIIGAAFHIFQSVFGGQTFDRALVARTFAEMLLALFSGFTGAIYFGPALAQIKPLGLEFSVEASSFAVGLVFYKMIPLIFNLTENFLKKKGKLP
jgi:hypothetical protein